MTAPVFTWTIDNFIDQTDNPINSQRFTIADHPQIEWHLKLYPRGDGQVTSESVSLYLSKTTAEFEVDIDFELVMVGNDAQAESKTCTHVFDSEKSPYSWGWAKFVSKSRLINDLLVDGSLKIQVKKAQVIRVVEVKDCLNATVFDWEIDNFLSLKEAKLMSKKFTIPGHSLIKWQLICYPKGVDSRINGNLKICTQKCTDDCEIEVEFRITIIGSIGKRMSKINKCGYKNPNDFSLDIHQDSLKNDNYLINGILKVQFKVFRVVKVVYQDYYFNYCYNKGSLDLDKKLCDFRLKTGDKSFDVHKLMLVRESAYFRKMFESDLKENEENEVNLSQFEENVIEEVYRFIYTGQLLNFDAISEKLIVAADYFQMDYLKILCQENISFRLSLDNCLDFLLTADQVNATLLKEAAMRFLNKNKTRMNKEKLTNFFKEHLELGINWLVWSSS